MILVYEKKVEEFKCFLTSLFLCDQDAMFAFQKVATTFWNANIASWSHKNAKGEKTLSFINFRFLGLKSCKQNTINGFFFVMSCLVQIVAILD